MKKRVVILGSTGSVGTNTLDVIAHLADRFEVVGLAANSRWKILAQQASRWRPDCVALANDAYADNLRISLNGNSEVLAGSGALVELVERVDCDCVVSAVVGAAGIPVTLRAVELGRHVALANKEALVVAGALLMPMAQQTGSQIIPIDSEHSAIFQAMHAGRRAEVKRVILTASGGPFRTWSTQEIEQATLEDALCHPTWNMGPKITIDSATMMNKALEVIEAHWLFGLQPHQIDVIIHPESIVHSLVEFCDGSVVAQLGTPDMRTPIQYALTYPERCPCSAKTLDLAALQRLHFEAPDTGRFPALRLGYEVAKNGGTAGAVLNAANEVAVELFRRSEIPFPEIVGLTEAVLRQHEVKTNPTLEDLRHADHWARSRVAHCLTRSTP